MDHAVVAIGIERLVRALCCQMAGGLALPALALTADFTDLGMGQTFAQGTEGSARLDRLQLLGITDQNRLGPTALGFTEHPLQLPRADHAGFVDHQHIFGGQTLTVLRPLVLQAGNGAGSYPGTTFKVLGGDAGQGNATHLVPGLFPRFPGHAEHGGLAGSGITDDDAKVVAFCDMNQRLPLLARQNQAMGFRLGQGPLTGLLGHPMLLALGHHVCCAVQALFDLEHLAAGEAVLVPSIPAQPH